MEANRTTEANHVVHEGKLKKGCFVRLMSFQQNLVKGKRYVPHSPELAQQSLTEQYLNCSRSRCPRRSGSM